MALQNSRQGHNPQEKVRPQSNLSSMKTTLSIILNVPESKILLQKFVTYQDYWDETWKLLRTGDPPESDRMAAINDEHVRVIVKTISSTARGSPIQRETLKESLAKDPNFESHSGESLDRTIDLAVRLWLVLNVRDDEYAPGVHSVQWDETTSLQTFIEQQFPKPRLLQELSEKMFDFVLPDNFNIVKLKRYSAIKVEWTHDLSQHLELDRDHRILKVFPLKHYVNEIRRSQISILPDKVLDEYTKTINLLFPSWDTKTQRFLRKKGQTFGMEGPVDCPQPLYLSDFHFFRDRLSALYMEFCSPPPSMTQLFNDRRNVLQWYTFWFAVVILGLTVVFGVISAVTAGLSTKYTYESLLLARQAASAAAQTCSPVTCPLP